MKRVSWISRLVAIYARSSTTISFLLGTGDTEILYHLYQFDIIKGFQKPFGRFSLQIAEAEHVNNILFTFLKFQLASLFK